jgi:hypothetical protein
MSLVAQSNRFLVVIFKIESAYLLLEWGFELRFDSFGFETIFFGCYPLMQHFWISKKIYFQLMKNRSRIIYMALMTLTEKEWEIICGEVFHTEYFLN